MKSPHAEDDAVERLLEEIENSVRSAASRGGKSQLVPIQRTVLEALLALAARVRKRRAVQVTAAAGQAPNERPQALPQLARAVVSTIKSGNGPLSRKDLAENLDVSEDELRPMLKRLVGEGYLRCAAEESGVVYRARS